MKYDAASIATAEGLLAQSDTILTGLSDDDVSKLLASVASMAPRSVGALMLNDGSEAHALRALLILGIRYSLYRRLLAGAVPA